jgi:hypothetical protein
MLLVTNFSPTLRAMEIPVPTTGMKFAAAATTPVALSAIFIEVLNDTLPSSFFSFTASVILKPKPMSERTPPATLAAGPITIPADSATLSAVLATPGAVEAAFAT